ncbi:Putative acyl-CoA dehydrogenase [Streptomyces venezuelae]|uniref:acyl-CoA dehydrogenase family protein n=1 Tax=Streptomyces gardneri TaxID=66892 RepID=UPI0006BDE50B|nr:acyl-CoA dehydrogenase family protein [Streptomyces gardneri]ALO10247.1 Putative acyl-CoA dehydrogenase [Streptomyces venezuelae]QPK47268.1 acyl-CoA/acyl-ACP dehydrogenase [Streptomyces gardneri]WRK38691.1 acyl-CoA dehydrogenase family protein [Streptomyces venezuelae]CUM39297.1 Butyryl-CoA dehydrogenase [Streptomyces venezuelae]
MDFRLTEDQRALRKGVRELLARLFDREALRAAVDSGGLDRELWRELGAAGFFALRLPEEEGGVGLGLPEAVLLFEEAGRVLLPGPLVATHVAAGSLRGAAEGDLVVTAVDGGLVPWLDDADVVLGDVEGAVPIRSVDPLTPLHKVPGTGGCAHPPRDSVRGPSRAERVPTTGPVLSAGDEFVAALLSAAEQVGSAGQTTDMAVAYARERAQFGQVIGGFQAVKHLCAGMLVRAELARAAVRAAAVTADPVEIAGAKLLADEAATANARDCLQVHGGMGFTWEADVHLHLKRAWVRAELWLPAARAEEVVAAHL